MKLLITRIRFNRRRRHGIPLYAMEALTPEEEAERYKNYIVTDPDELREIAIDTVQHLERFGKDYQRFWIKTYAEKHNINLDDIEI